MKSKTILFVIVSGLLLLLMIGYYSSSEMFNAFDSLDSSMQENNALLAAANDDRMAVIRERYEESGGVKALEYAKQVHHIVLEFEIYVDTLIDVLVEHGGGYAGRGEHTKLKNAKDKKIVDHVMMGEGQGKILFQKINDTRDSLTGIAVREFNREVIDLPLKIDSTYLSSKQGTWEDYQFKSIPLLPTVVLLRKYLNDAKASEGILLDLILQKY